MKIKFIIPVIIFTFLLSCTQSHVQSKLLDIESYIMDRPDSALVVLEAMDRNLLVTEEDRAHHALLHAMALDKNFIDVSDDSLARVAVDYYSENGPRKYYARSLYYLGVAYYYQGEYNKAIVEFTNAEQIAAGNDLLYLAMTKSSLSDTYAQCYNYVEELLCLIGQNTKKRYTIGDKVFVKVVAASKEAKAIDFELVGDTNDRDKKQESVL